MPLDAAAPTPVAPVVAGAVGQGLSRVDGPAKVCGLARYSGDFTLPGMVHASLLLSSVARGRIRRFDTAAAQAVPGVLHVLTPANAPRLPVLAEPVGRTLSLLQDARIHHDRQPIALVIAQTLEAAREAVDRLRVEYETEPASLDFAQAKADAQAPQQAQGQPADSLRGDVEAGWRASVHRVQATWTTPTEYHNPIEPHATLAAWDGEELTLYDATQSVQGVRKLVAQRLGIAPAQVRVINPYVGGAFGGKGSVWSHVLLAAMAAREVGRPVRLALERPQMFGPVGNRPRTEQRLRLGADAAGRLLATEHAVHAETARIEDWLESSAIVTRMLYACDHLATSHRLVALDVPVPTFQRAPGEATGSFALECAMDELAQACALDPVELRVRNHATHDGGSGKPFSSKSLLACYREGAEAFGWSRRDPRPGSMTDGPWRVGWGMATATYPCHRLAAEACASWLPDGSARVQCGTQDLGTGTYTVLTQVAADTLGLPMGRVQLQLGDSALPVAPISGGSMTVASTAPAVQAACEQAREQLIALAIADAESPLHASPRDQVVVIDGRLALRDDASCSEPVATLLARHPGRPIESRGRSEPGPEADRYSRHAFGAVFAEVRIDRDLGEIRVPRIVGAYGVGRLLNEKTGRSQLMGGIVWGVSMALFEDALRDGRYGRIANANLAEYHVPVNADIASIEVIVVPEHDPHVNPLGAKGIGEIGITGVAAAIANAVWHATGRRIRKLPITLDGLL